MKCFDGVLEERTGKSDFSTWGCMAARERFHCRMRCTCHRFQGRRGRKARWRGGNARRCLPGAPEI